MTLSVAGKPFYLDTPLLIVCVSLLLLGYIMVASSSLHLGERLAHNSLHYPVRQLVHIVLGVVIAGLVACVPLTVWQRIAPLLFVGGLVLLVVVLVPGIGIKVNGSVRWLAVGGIRIQVSEVLKFTAVIYIASYVSRHQEHVQLSPYGLAMPLSLFLVASFLLLLEPDFGSAVVLLVIAMGVLFLAGAKLKQFMLLAGLMIISAALLIYFSPYRLIRLLGFIDPWADPENTGFQLVQALIAFGRGEFFGVGLGSGLQKLFYLPEAHTDFLFSVLAEELGLMGVLITIALFSLFLWRAFAIAAQAEQVNDTFAAFTAYGLGVWFGFQSFVNMGVNTGILPTKGLTLPLMSYGGGSMITMCAAVALLFRVHNDVVKKQLSSTRRSVK